MEENNQKTKKSTASSIVKRFILFLTITGTSLLGLFLIGGLVMQTLRSDAVYIAIIIKHYPATIGLPLSGFAAFVLVFLLEHSRGPIEFEGLGFKFKGASGPLVFWLICFMAINTGIYTLWTREFHSPVAEKILEDLVSEQIKQVNYDRRLHNCIDKIRKQGKVKDKQKIKDICSQRLIEQINRDISSSVSSD